MSSFIDLVAMKTATNLSDMRSVTESGNEINQEGADSPVDVKNQMLASKRPDHRYVSIPNLEDPKPVNSDIMQSPHPVQPNMMKVAPPYIPPPPPQPAPAPQQQGAPPPPPAPAQPQPIQPPAPPMQPLQPPQLPQPQAKQAFMNGIMPVGLMPKELLGVPRQDEGSLQRNYEVSRDKILNMAGQLDPATGQPIKVRDVDRIMTSLNAAAQRALNNMRISNRVYKEPAEKQSSFIDTLIEKRANPMANPGMYSVSPGPMAGMPPGMSPYNFSHLGFNHAGNLNPYIGQRYGVTPGPFGAQQNMLFNQGFNDPYSQFNRMPGISPYPAMPTFGGAGYTPYNPMYQSFGYSPQSRDYETRPRLDSIRSEINDLRQRKLNTELETEGMQDPDLASQYKASLQRLRDQARTITAHGDHTDAEGKPLIFQEGKNVSNYNGLWRLLSGRTAYTDESMDSKKWADFLAAKQRAEELKEKLRGRQTKTEAVVGGATNERLTNLDTQRKAYEDEERRRFEQERSRFDQEQKMRTEVFNRMMNPQPYPQMQQPHMAGGQQPQMPQQPTTTQAPQQQPPNGLPALPPGHAPAPQAPVQPQPNPGALVDTSKGVPDLTPDLTKKSSASELAFRDMFQKEAGPYMDSAATLAKLIGGGSATGSIYGALTAPSDYMLEGAGRGALVGGTIGAGLGLGGAAGKYLGRGASKLTDLSYGRTAPSPIAEAIWGNTGMALGVAPAGLLAGIKATKAIGVPAWDAGDIPLTEQVQLALRRRNNAPDFQNPLMTGNRVPNPVDAPMGLNILKSSAAKALDSMQNKDESVMANPYAQAAAIAGAGTVAGAGIGGGIGAGKGIYRHYVPEVTSFDEGNVPPKPKTMGSRIGGGALRGAASVGIPATMLAAMVLGNRLYNG